jgi:hypothetical protein
MSPAAGVDVGGGALAAGLLVAAAGAIFLGLSWIATPPGFNARIAQVESKVGAAEDALSGAHHAAAFPASAVCQSGVGQGAASLRTRVQGLAGQSGVTLTSLAITPMEASGDGARIAPASLQFEATGRYDQVMTLLTSLARSSPTVFVDTADLTSQVSSVDLKFAGRIYCSAVR